MATERPIIFSGTMVQAILAGTKSQTRRIVSGHPHALPPLNICCPYGNVGDRLWVRETWRQALADHGDCWAYRADQPYACGKPVPTDVRWRPSIHMPRRASRITLSITGVRVERLQDITAADAVAEGVVDPTHGWNGNTYYPLARFKDLWESINGQRASWSDNPFVWAISFRRVQP